MKTPALDSRDSNTDVPVNIAKFLKTPILKNDCFINSYSKKH